MFDITIYNNGRPSKYGNTENEDLEETIESLMHYDFFLKKYSEEDLEEYLNNMKVGSVIFKDTLIDIKITKK